MAGFRKLRTANGLRFGLTGLTPVLTLDRDQRMRVPQLRKHATGQFFVRYGGRDHYLGHDKKAAEKQYLDHLDGWRHWRGEKSDRAERDKGRGRKLLGEVAEAFFKEKQRELGPDGRYFYEKTLRPLLMAYAAEPIDWIRPRHLNAIKSDMLAKGKKPKTINHVLNSTRSLMRWAGAMEFVTQPLDFTVVRNVPIGPVRHQHASAIEVIEAVRQAPEHLRPILAVQYLGVMRPTEVMRIVNREGEWVDRGVFVLDRGKMDRKVSMHRHLMVSDEAMGWLDMAEPRRYTTLAGYSSAVRGYRHSRGGWVPGPFPLGPKVLQKSAAQHLVMRGVPDADIELLLGHYTNRLSVTYFSRNWGRLRQQASMLGLGPACVSSSALPPA